MRSPACGRLSSVIVNNDPDLPVPRGVQLRGVIEYGIVCGQLQPGERLPPVRSMARQLGIAPMTVSQVYKELKEVGLLETKQGNGTFVSSSVGSQPRSDLLGLQQRIDQLLESKRELADKVVLQPQRSIDDMARAFVVRADI